MRPASIVKPNNQTSIKLLPMTTFHWSSPDSVKKKKKKKARWQAEPWISIPQKLSQLIRIPLSSFSYYRRADEWHQRPRRWHVKGGKER